MRAVLCSFALLASLCALQPLPSAADSGQSPDSAPPQRVQGSFSMPQAGSTETDFVVTVKARDAKFIGTGAGGAQVVVRNRLNGDVLASGIVYGGTGDTAAIMGDNRARDAVLTDDGTARLEFALDLWEPTPVTVTATGPLGQAQSAVSVSEDMLLIPGKDYTSGNGILLDMPGFAVKLLSPAPGRSFPVDPDNPVVIEANVMKLCGCKVAENGPWPPERYQVDMRVYKDNLFISSVPMPYAGEPGLYRVKLGLPLPGAYRLLVTAFDPLTKEGGMDTTSVILTGTPQDTP